MPFTPDNIYHIYNQGNNRQTIFCTRKDYLTFLNLYKRLIAAKCDTIAWCLMPNHFHFMIYTDDRCNTLTKQGNLLLDPITNGIRKLLSGYARIFNTQNGQTGSVFRQKTKHKCLSEIEIKPGNKFSTGDYYTNCFYYIHQNPLVAKLADKLEEWEFSSFQDYSNLRKGTLCNKELAVKYCNFDVDLFIKNSNELLKENISAFFD